jgi:ribosome-associated protein
MTLEEQIKIIKTALEDKKAVDIKAYDVRGVSGFADAFVVATGTAAPHLKALIAGVQGAMKDVDVDSYRTSGDPQSGWIVVDYVDIVVHVFSPEARAYYALEKLWKDAKPL